MDECVIEVNDTFEEETPKKEVEPIMESDSSSEISPISKFNEVERKLDDQQDSQSPERVTQAKKIQQKDSFRNLCADSKKFQKRYTKRGSKLFSGYAADLINLKEKPLPVPSVVDIKNIKSTLAPIFSNNRKGRKSFVVPNSSLFNKSDKKSSFFKTNNSKPSSNNLIMLSRK